MGTRRQFNREFKVEAVKLVKERGVSVTQAARDLNVHQTMLRSWIRELAADPQQAFPGKGIALASRHRWRHLPQILMLSSAARSDGTGSG